MNDPAGSSVRTDLGGVLPDQPGAVLIRLVHASDAHVLDAASPARAEWVELVGHDPLWRPLLHMHRPHDTLTAHALRAHVAAINDHGPDLTVFSGDNIDNAQRNELDAYLSIVGGGTAQLSAVGSAQDASCGAYPQPWPFWSPDPAVDDAWRPIGYPAVDDFVERASAPLASTGLKMPWTSVPGNHDLMRQGTALPVGPLEQIAVGATKSLVHPSGFLPADPLSLYIDEPEAFSSGPGFPVAAEPSRRAIDRREWIAAHVTAGALGYSAREVAAAAIDTVIDTEHIRFILLDTNHPYGDYQGSVGTSQLVWLDERLAEVDRDPGRLAIIVSHHGVDTLVNQRGHDDDRLLGEAFTAVVHSHPSAVAWLVGHRHINRIEARPGISGGFWEITTCSIIDWPSQTRAIDVIRHRDGTIELTCTMLDHHDAADGLATLHRDLAHRFTTTGVATRMAGRSGDADVRLVLGAR
ncbi:MAG: hypothetical protein ABIR32_18830 [Ilumatobacteraceae bacterium]